MYVLTRNGELRSVGRADAKVRWTVPTPAGFRGKLLTPGAVGGGRLVMASTDGDFLAVDTGDGRTAWNRLDHVDTAIRPVVDGDTVYLNGRTLDAVRIGDGETIWSVKPAGGTYRTRWGPATVSGGALYATEGLYPTRLDPRDGSPLWSGYPSTTIAYAGRVLAQGRAVWSLDGGVGDTTPMELDAARASDGSRRWRYQFPSTQYRLLTADGNRVFLLHDSKVIAFATF